MYLIRIHRKRFTERKPGKNKNQWVVLAAYYETGAYGTWQRHLRHIGAEDSHVADRLMDADEERNTREAWRLHSYRYSTWEGLFKDEYRITSDRDWIQKLIDISREKISADQIIKFIENERAAEAAGKIIPKENDQLTIFES